MEHYIVTIAKAGGCAVGLVLVVFVIWFIIKDTWNTTQDNGRD